MTQLTRAVLSFATLVCVSTAVAVAQGPDRSLRISVGGGLMVADQGAQALQSGQGLSGFVRLGWSGSPLLLDGSIENQPARVLFAAPCPSFESCNPQPLSVPTTALTLAPALQWTERGHMVSMLYRIGPSASWLVDRMPGSTAVTPGFRAGISLRLGAGNSGLLLSGDYFRLFRGGTAPQWFLPITIGWEF